MRDVNNHILHAKTCNLSREHEYDLYEILLDLDISLHSIIMPRSGIQVTFALY